MFRNTQFVQQNTAQGPKRLISKRIKAILAPKGMPLGECRFESVRSDGPDHPRKLGDFALRKLAV